MWYLLRVYVMVGAGAVMMIMATYLAILAGALLVGNTRRLLATKAYLLPKPPVFPVIGVLSHRKQLP
jgi:hypothetical protein